MMDSPLDESLFSEFYMLKDYLQNVGVSFKWSFLQLSDTRGPRRQKNAFSRTRTTIVTIITGAG